jgi:hypothetical protein
LQKALKRFALHPDKIRDVDEFFDFAEIFAYALVCQRPFRHGSSRNYLLVVIGQSPTRHSRQGDVAWSVVSESIFPVSNSGVTLTQERATKSLPENNLLN